MINHGSLTVLDSSSDQKGTILGSTYNDSCYLINVHTYGQFTLNSGTLHVAPETYENEKHSYGIYFEEEYGDCSTAPAAIR